MQPILVIYVVYTHANEKLYKFCLKGNGNQWNEIEVQNLTPVATFINMV